MHDQTAGLFSKERVAFHRALLGSVLICNENQIPSNADKSQSSSVAFARSIFEQIGGSQTTEAEGLCAQSKGDNFEHEVCRFLQSTFPKLSDLRPGKWEIMQLKGRNKNMIGAYAQYAHLHDLSQFILTNHQLAAWLGNEYTVAPDVVIVRHLEQDSELNRKQRLVDGVTALAADLRYREGKFPLLHASISCKWTLRSDRAQNARAEALNMIRNRKGHQPHIVIVTGEPTPSRLSSIALGTGDIDCVYHFALYELQQAIASSNNDEAMNMLQTMVEGRRLKDISDLPLDLVV